MSVSFDSATAFTLLNSLFEARSYVAGYEVTDKDTEVFNALTEGPNEAAYPHAARWYKHIAGVKGLAAKAGSAAPAPAAAAAEEEDDDEVDLFGSDDEEVDEAAEKLKQQRLAEYAAKKALKPKTIAKSMCTLDVKPWDDETDMKEVEEYVRSITMEGLLWGQSKLVAIGYGIKKLQINCVIEDELVSLVDLEDKIMEKESHIQSMDMAAMQKI
ncbi:Translation elongation factor 1 beta [Mortierella polycephala]|uniref:Translation elongation factor 1 beta n=1 Tax=Mortierella polycephala TaxID=41804 RepID=A0A9P6TXY4_9FUNG|nr:Translation elongation factor 1 beta [Mortierella polycephala]